MKLSRILLISLLLGLFPSCLKTEVINAIEPEEHEVVVEKRKKPEKPLPEKPEQTDTTRVPIGFEPSVEDWNESNNNVEL